MIYDIDIAKQIAKSSLQINAIILQPNQPFKWAAGWNSPIYCDNRKTLSYPEIRNHIRQGLAAIVKNHYKGANVIAGVATAGIPHGALVAEELGLPFIYVRSKAKEVHMTPGLENLLNQWGPINGPPRIRVQENIRPLSRRGYPEGIPATT